MKLRCEMLQVEYSLAATPYTLFCQRTEVLAVDNYRQKLSCSVCTWAQIQHTLSLVAPSNAKLFGGFPVGIL